MGDDQRINKRPHVRSFAYHGDFQTGEAPAARENTGQSISSRCERFSYSGEGLFIYRKSLKRSREEVRRVRRGRSFQTGRDDSSSLSWQDRYKTLKVFTRCTRTLPGRVRAFRLMLPAA